MLKYEISDNKEENELLDGLLGGSTDIIMSTDPLTSTVKKGEGDKHKDGQMISTDAFNRSQIY